MPPAVICAARPQPALGPSGRAPPQASSALIARSVTSSTAPMASICVSSPSESYQPDSGAVEEVTQRAMSALEARGNARSGPGAG